MLKMITPFSHFLLVPALLLFNIPGCGTYRPESMESKISHYNSEDQKTNQVPNLSLHFDKLPKAAQINVEVEDESKDRSPSSVSTKTRHANKGVNFDNIELTNFSNKKLYFLALFDQYNTLSSYSPSTTTQLKSCPNFHSGIIEQLGDYPDPNNFKTPLRAQDYQASTSHVGLQLPMQKNDFHPTVKEFFTSTPGQNLYDLQVKALDIHLSKIYDELNELCQYGTSDNYYIFENLMTYIQTKKLNMNDDNFQILMRTTLFTNQVLNNTFAAQSTQGRQPAAGKFTRHYFDGVVKRLNVEWASAFIDPAQNHAN